MSAARIWIGAVVVGLFGAVTPARAETVEEVEKAIAEAYKKVTSMTASMRTVTEVNEEQFRMKSTSEGRFEMLRKDGKVLTRTELKEATVTDSGGEVEKRASTTLSIMDGDYIYTLSEVDGKKSASKMKLTVDPTVPSEKIKDTDVLTLLPDEKIDGAEVWVMQYTPKDAKDKSKTVMYYRKDCGLAVKIVAFGENGKPTSTMTYSHVKLDASLSPDRFVFKAPEGVKVVEVTDRGHPEEEDTLKTQSKEEEEEAEAEAPKADDQPKKKPGLKPPKLPKLP